MKKYIHIALKVVLSLLLIMPILGTLGIFPAPTRELYNTDQAFAFIEMLSAGGYIMWMMAVVHIVALIALWTRREALAALLVLPITANIVGFHAFLDGGLFTAGAVMGNILLVLNLYLLWYSRETLRGLFVKRA